MFVPNLDREPTPMRSSRPRGTDAPIRVLIVDAHPIVRIGLTSLFARERNVEVVGQCGTVGEALDGVATHQPEVILMDVHLPDGTGIEACRQIRAERPESKVVMLSGVADDESVIGAVLAGAHGFLLKTCAPERLIEAVESAAMGGALLDNGVTQTVLEWMRNGRPRTDDSLACLSEQERRILPLIACGKTNRQIGQTLYLSEHTVKTYVSSLLRKLQLARRSEAAAFVARHDLRAATPSILDLNPGRDGPPRIDAARQHGQRTSHVVGG